MKKMKKRIFRAVSSSFSLVFLCLLLWLFLPVDPLLAMPPVQKSTLSNRLVLLLSEEHSLPFVTIQLLIDAGSRRDPQGKEGLAHLTARGLLLGTSRYTVTEINKELDFLGASLHSSADKDYTSLSLKVLKKDLDAGFNLFMEILTQPTFPEEEIQREVEKILAAIESAEDQPDEVAQKAFRKALFLSGAYGHPVEGTKESVSRFNRAALVEFYRSYYAPNHSILALVGDITAEEVKTKLLPRLEQWPMSEIPEATSPKEYSQERKSIFINRDITQANIILGHIGVRRDHPDFYALSVMNYILGSGGFSSRLMEEIRSKRGLAYAVTSFFDSGKLPGSFQIVLQTKNSSAREAISLALQQVELIREKTVTEKELEGAKKYLIGSFPMRLNTQGKLANFLTLVEFYGLGLDYPEKYPSFINAVTEEEVRRVASEYLYPEKSILVVVANLKETGMEQ